MEVTLGLTYRDKITGAFGVAVSKTQYLFASERVGIQLQTLKQGTPVEPLYFDIAQLVLFEVPGKHQYVDKLKHFVTALADDSDEFRVIVPEELRAKAAEVLGSVGKEAV